MYTESLLDEIMNYFPKRRKSVLKNVLILSLSLLLKQTVCLNRLKGIVSTVTGNFSQPSSNYKRLTRIFNSNSRSNLWLELLIFVFRVLRHKTDRLLIDGTSWKRGKKWYHFMTLCVIYRGVAIPIFWVDLAKRGISSQEERKKLIARAMKHFNLSGKTLIGDREYVGEDWFKYMKDNDLEFCIRLKRKTYSSLVDNGLGKSYDEMCSKVLRSKVPRKGISKIFRLNGLDVLFVVAKNPKDDPKEPLIFLLSSKTEWSAAAVVAEYGLRYKIEHCFKHLKSNGFNLEQMNLRTKTKCRLLMAVTVFAYVLSIHEGLKKYQNIPLKNYGTYKEKSESVFRLGLDKLMKWCSNLLIFCSYIIEEIIRPKSKYKSPFCINVQ